MHARTWRNSETGKAGVGPRTDGGPAATVGAGAPLLLAFRQASMATPEDALELLQVSETAEVKGEG